MQVPLYWVQSIRGSAAAHYADEAPPSARNGGRRNPWKGLGNGNADKPVVRVIGVLRGPSNGADRPGEVPVAVVERL